VIFGILGLAPALGADCWSAAISGLPLPEKFLRSQKDLKDGEDLAGYDETQAPRAFATALDHKEKRRHTLMPTGPKGEKR